MNQAEHDYYHMVKSDYGSALIKPGDKVILLKQGLSGVVQEISEKKQKFIQSSLQLN